MCPMQDLCDASDVIQLVDGDDTSDEVAGDVGLVMPATQSRMSPKRQPATLETRAGSSPTPFAVVGCHEGAQAKVALRFIPWGARGPRSAACSPWHAGASPLPRVVQSARGQR
jgi:hypothetical protein